MTNLIAEGFSLSHAAILDGSTGAEHVDGDIYGAVSYTHLTLPTICSV